ncbi:molybdate ABC transporter permease subunit [Acinetobacter gerneri]|uniref:molybdate ABC transporter permease subunit n=1 Tax=Acinetobacter gerneri TaxID=202952 RepID=UPI0028A820EF|nr:molybdate ABC transporter permease subunit [Acinetobacter gerneri]MDV2439081.1 molybdate ABC transporter permease subunit [Acinetobacter gerneri]
MQEIWVALWLSLKVAFFATLINFFLGIMAASLLHRYKNKVTELIEILLTLPMVLPPTVLGYYLLVCFGSQSAFGQLLSQLGIKLIFTINGAILAATIVTFPLVLKPLLAAFEQIPSNIVDAAKVIRLNYFQIIYMIILPMAWESVVAGLLLSFARSLGEFGATLMIAGSIPGKTQTISIRIWEAVQAGDEQQAMLLVMIISFVCLFILFVVKKINKRAWKLQG